MFNKCVEHLPPILGAGILLWAGLIPVLVEFTAYLLVVCSFVHSFIRFLCFCLIYSFTHHALSPSRYQAGVWEHGADWGPGLALEEPAGSWGTRTQTQITRAQSVACLPTCHKLASLPLQLQSLFSPLHILSVSSLPICVAAYPICELPPYLCSGGWLSLFCR